LGDFKDLGLNGFSNSEAFVLRGGAAFQPVKSTDGDLGHAGKLDEGALILQASNNTLD
jgi:hypothetical protein